VSHVLNPIALRNKSHHQYSGSAYEVLLWNKYIVEHYDIDRPV
jgi:hypothetical protein